MRLLSAPGWIVLLAWGLLLALSLSAGGRLLRDSAT